MEEVRITCRDGYALAGHVWLPEAAPIGTVIVNPATGVLARYYHRYARFLAGHGFAVLTYDYRGIGGSRPARLRGSRISWRDWGERDFDAAVHWARQRDPSGPLMVVGHSIGGFLPGFAERTIEVDRILTVGAQYAYFRDYAAKRQAALFLKWHLAMPLLASVCGYFPGRQLGWLEDRPAGVAHEWSFRRRRMELSYRRAERQAILDRFAAVQAPILAIGLTDDEFGTPAAIRRSLSYYKGCDRSYVQLKPVDLGFAAIGHFGLFHARHEPGFWRSTLSWLRDGVNPWAGAEAAAF